MKRPLALVGALATSAGLLAGTLAPLPAAASSHREAPLIAADPYADLTDLYAFRDTDSTVTFIVDAIPYEDPMGGPNFYKFDDKVRYELHVALAGHNTADITYRMTFATRVKNGGTFLYNTGPLSGMPGDANLNVEQTATVMKVTKDGEIVVGSDLPVQPVNIGPRSNPAGDSGQDFVSTLPNGEGKFYAGQRGDPFFLDLSVFDLLALRPLNNLHAIPQPTGDGVNSFQGFNVHSIALQVPITKLTTDGQAAKADGSNSIIGVWATTLRQKTRVLGGNTEGPWIQIERLGNPLVNEVVIPLAAKDLFNSVAPDYDAHFLSPDGNDPVQNPELGRLIPALYPGVTVPSGPRKDLVTIFLTGIPGLNQPANVMASEMLRLNMGIAPSASIGSGNRMGVLDGDTAGFPNGRRLEDDVVDIALQAVAGATPLTPDFNHAPNNLIGDGVDQSAQPFNAEFPYLSAPWQGYGHAAGTAAS